ncbi:MAG: (2Fe-2S)-binding protein, partial [Candidatus Electrothrix sp. AR5]|nr:(2Fe-2S)-binding protein [Candidatus Electrothrix sp. AR5]
MLVIVNKEQQELNCSPGYPVLDLLRADMKLTGTKAACREGDCGTCLILLGELDNRLSLSYRAVNSCILPAAAVEGRHVVTIEGLADREPSPLSNLSSEEGASQCGFCSPGIVIAMTAY